MPEEEPTEVGERITVDHHCSFCGRAPGAVGPLVAGPRARICRSCVDLATEALEAAGRAPRVERTISVSSTSPDAPSEVARLAGILADRFRNVSIPFRVTFIDDRIDVSASPPGNLIDRVSELIDGHIQETLRRARTEG